MFNNTAVIIYSDDCECGIGGYSSELMVWIWELPPKAHRNITLNLPELLEKAISIHLTIYHIGK